MPPPIETRAAANMRRLREARDMTQIELGERAAKLGHTMNEQRICGLEAGRRRMNVADLSVVAAVFDVTCEQLLSPDPDALFGTPPAVSYAVTVDGGMTQVVTADRTEVDPDGWLNFHLRGERVFFAPASRVLCVQVAGGSGNSKEGGS
ncbi:helix-turn-helix transcriptional regulator [Streptomyces sp. ActVer]|uniref:helix-turn-helix domain-containing protein n=1 Tax=Streptomyces sp. ActVer TaxID=3014558 RepID=UPI0022B380E4|nr:helix-turn-helix transcriptional regulator [Streptomyces sp. ActVer]MCZ4506944.1 helix-turn-helix transcriptional regulator [Streptomyces sp. ActVer]